jgi:cholesterol oxidase
VEGLADWTNEMPAHFASARKMLGVTENRILGEADDMLKKMADDQGCGDSFYRTDVAVYFGDKPGVASADPYFDGEGPERSSCIGCGGCMVGCRFNAKNTLDKNYLYFAEKRGAQVIAETRVVDVRPLGAPADATRVTERRRRGSRSAGRTARHVVSQRRRSARWTC